MKTIMAISGSLRLESKNTIILRELKKYFQSKINIEIYEGLVSLPHFSPDIEFQDIPSVSQYRDQLKKADAILISTPEYAHGIPGSLKNALDWIVGSGELMDKKVGIIFSSSSDSLFVQEQLIEVIKTMSANIRREDCLKISGANLTPKIIELVHKL